MPVPRTEATSLSEFTQWVEEVSDLFDSPPIWFRGVARERYQLLPGLYRSKEGRAKWTDDELRAEFSRRAIALPKELLPRTDWEWYFLMQHYRVPTRLLDWSEAAMVALYFAIAAWEDEEKQVRVAAAKRLSTPRRDARRDPLPREERPAVWALDPWTFNDHRGFEGPMNADASGIGPYLPPVYSGRPLPLRPVAVDPPFVAQRLMVQRSHFTLHGRDARPLEQMPHMRWSTTRRSKRKPILVRVTIKAGDADELEYLRGQIELCGITPTSIFPDMEGLARELVQEYQVR